MKSLLAGAALALGATLPIVVAQPAPLTLDECLALAAQHHPALAVAQAGVSAATETVGEARAPYYPQVDLNAGYHRWQRRAFLPSGLVLPGGTPPELIGPLDDWNGGLTGRVTLFDFGERRAGVEAARARQAGAVANAAVASADVRLNAESAFYALAAAQELRGVAAQNLSRTEAHQRLASARREAGAVPQADVLRTQAEVAAARLQLIDAESRVRICIGRLNTAIDRPAATPLAITADPAANPPPDVAELERTIEGALARRPELLAAEKRSAAARAAVTAARASRAPKLRADGSYGWRDVDWMPETEEWQAGISIDLPIFDGGARTRRLARSKAELAREEAALENSRLQIREEVWSAATELERAWAAIGANETSVQASSESLRIVQERYESGAALLTDLLDTQTALTRAEASLAEARWTYLTARAVFARAVGAKR